VGKRNFLALDCCGAYLFFSGGVHTAVYIAFAMPTSTKAIARCNFNHLRTEIAQHPPCQDANPANATPYRNGNFFR
jgi:hypothetical protein